MASPPASTKTSLRQRLNAHARTRGWDSLDHIATRHRGQFAYIDATLTNGETIPLCRLRYAGSANRWGFALYRASHDDYQDNLLPTGSPAGTPEEALDCAGDLYLTANWFPGPTPTN